VEVRGNLPHVARPRLSSARHEASRACGFPRTGVSPWMRAGSCCCRHSRPSIAA
jgi:hypothetical protein